jgi:hypothetical protein
VNGENFSLFQRAGPVSAHGLVGSYIIDLSYTRLVSSSLNRRLRAVVHRYGVTVHETTAFYPQFAVHCICMISILSA